MKQTTARHETAHKLSWLRCSRFWLGLVLALLLASSCHLQEDTTQRRVRFAKDSREDIRVGIAWPFSVDPEDLFHEGVNLALDEVNQAGGVLGRKLQARFADDRSSSHEGLVVAQEFAKDPKLLYVIGHCDMNVATPASLIYQVNGILFITPGGTSSKTARRGLDLVFNSYPGEHEISDSLVDYCSRRKYQRIAFIYQNTPYGIESTASFEQHAGEKGLDIVARLPYDRPDVRVVRGIVDHFQISESPDAIFVVGLMPGVAQVIAGIRRLGVTQPILATEDVDDDQYLQIAGSAAEGTVIPSAFPLNSPRHEVADFVQRFQALHHKPPSSWAAQGYDAVKLLAFAVQSANSADPATVAAVLRQIKDWPGVTGLHTFNTEGEVVGKKMVLKQVQNGQFVFLEEAGSAGSDH